MYEFLPEEKDSKIKELLSETEIEYLEKWTRKSVKSIVYDSKIDGWSTKKCTFNEKILGKKQLVFLIEDKDGEKFGMYFNPSITSIKSTNIGDEKCFNFNLKCNRNRLTKPMIFKSYEDQTIDINLSEKKEYKLCELGDIWINKNGNDCCIVVCEKIVDYKKDDYALCGKASVYGESGEGDFDIKSLHVIQMI